MNYKELAKDILKLHTPDPQVILEIAREQQETLKKFDESFKEGVEVLAKAHAHLISAQESEAVWKTEADKSDQRRLDAEAELTACHAQSHGMSRRVVEAEMKLEVSEAEVEGLRELQKAQDEYIHLLSDEIDEVKGIAHAHGWKSSRYDEGRVLRGKIEALTK